MIKTKEEQVKEIKQAIDSITFAKNGQVQTSQDQVIKTTGTALIAKKLIEAGYVDVSEYKNRFEVADKVLTEMRAKLTKAEHDRDRYKAEIERLEATLGQCNTELNSALESLKSQCREIGELKAENETYCKQINQAYDTGYDDGYDSCQDDIKQAQIDVLNKLKKKMYYIYEVGTGIFLMEHDIDEFIKEVQNAEDNG